MNLMKSVVKWLRTRFAICTCEPYQPYPDAPPIRVTHLDCPKHGKQNECGGKA